MGLFRKKTVKATDTPVASAATSSTPPALASTSEAPVLPPRPSTPEQASTSAVIPEEHHEQPHALSTDHAVDADAHQREGEAKEAHQQHEIDSAEHRDSLAGGPGGLGSAAVLGGGALNESSPSYPQEKSAAAPLDNFGASNEQSHTYPAEKVGAAEGSHAVHENGVQDDGMMKGFVPVPGAHTGETSHSHSQESSAVGAVTPNHQDEKSNHHVAEGVAAGGLAGVGAGAFAANGHGHAHSQQNDKAIFDHAQHQEAAVFDHAQQNQQHGEQAHVPTPIQTSNLAATPQHQADTPTSATSPLSPQSPPLSASAMAKIKKNEYKDGKRLEKIYKQEAKDDQKTLDAAIKELASLQKIHRDASASEAKAAKAHNEALKVEQKANVRFLKEKAIYDKAHTAMKGREQDLETNRATAARQNQLLEEQTAKVEHLRETKAREDRERAQKLGTIKRK